MKIVLAGSSGFIGQEVLEQCIRNPAVSSIVALSRRQLKDPYATDPKVQVIIVDDYLSYTSSTLQATDGARACIWSLGKAWIPDNATTRRVCVDYPLAAARAFAQQHKASQAENKFRFVYLSGGAVERDQSKSLWFQQDYRKIRGQAETELLAHAKENSDVFESYIMRPGMVLAKDFNLRDMVRGLGPSLPVDVLAKAMQKVALEGHQKDTIENSMITAEGRGA
ncbi:hypothetical protein GGI35DRAFT_485892 [Trichoderma velutinum]